MAERCVYRATRLLMENNELISNYTKPRSIDDGDASKGKTTHLLAVPFTGLGLYSGFRGARWLKNRVKIFEQFVVPSLLNQSYKDFIVWIAWRPEERFNSIVRALKIRLENIKELRFVHTFSGCPIYDDKYPPTEARERLLMAIHGAMHELVNVTAGADFVLMTIQPSDDCYIKTAVEGIQSTFKQMPNLQACGFTKGYLMNNQTLEVAEWTPETNPPFYTIKFPRTTFINPLEHAQYTSLKHDVPNYKAGTPLPSHEWVKDCLNYGQINERGFLVGTHGENISTIWNHPYKGEMVTDVLKDFGLENVLPLKLPFSFRRVLFSKLPHRFQRKLRYLAGEKQWILRPLFAIIYNGLRA